MAGQEHDSSEGVLTLNPCLLSCLVALIPAKQEDRGEEGLLAGGGGCLREEGQRERGMMSQ